MTIPLDVSGLNFRAGLGPGPGLGRAARVFYSVKQLKMTFVVGLGPKIFLRALRSLPTVRGRAGPGPGQRAGLGRAQNAQVYALI
jgi:hypothetical protein